MAEKLTPQGLVVGIIPEAIAAQDTTPAPAPAQEKPAARGGRKPRTKE